jgi:hypothetical protein
MEIAKTLPVGVAAIREGSLNRADFDPSKLKTFLP